LRSGCAPSTLRIATSLTKLRSVAEVLVAGFDAQPAEGEPPNSTVVLRFPDAEAAWGLLNDPDYALLKEIRFSITSRGQAVVAPEFVPVG
jgi:uncharacterized protein (DUF1330 family)